MKLKPYAGSVANRSGDRRIISASLTGKNCPCPRRFHGAHGHLQTPPQNWEAALGSRRVPAKSRNFPPLSRPFPQESQDIPTLSQRVPPLSRPVPPLCSVFPGNPGHFPRRAGFSPEIPALSPGILRRSPRIPKAPGDSQDVSLEPFTTFQPFHGRINH